MVSSHGFVNGVCPSPSCVYGLAASLLCRVLPPRAAIKNQRGIALNGPPSKFSVVLPSIRWAGTDRELSSVYYSALTIDAYKPLYKALSFNHTIYPRHIFRLPESLVGVSGEVLDVDT